jgi:hypothetical protein
MIADSGRSTGFGALAKAIAKQASVAIDWI